MMPEALRPARTIRAKSIPARQPATAITTPSERNIRRMPAGRVPSARSVPISRVRSVTAMVITIAADRTTITTSTAPTKPKIPM